MISMLFILKQFQFQTGNGTVSYVLLPSVLLKYSPVVESSAIVEPRLVDGMIAGLLSCI